MILQLLDVFFILSFFLQIVPLARVIMQTKNQRTYELVLRKMVEIIPRFDPEEVMCDFEPAQENAVRTVFPRAAVHGCLFHSTKVRIFVYNLVYHRNVTCFLLNIFFTIFLLFFCFLSIWWFGLNFVILFLQAIGKKARKLRLVSLIRRNHLANSIVRSMCALALLPSHDIPAALGKLARHAKREGVWDALHRLFLYFKTYWLRRKSILSVYECDDRTNNACESDNRTFRDSVKVKHANIFCFLSKLVHYWRVLFRVRRCSSYNGACVKQETFYFQMVFWN